jgi:signal peptidase II
MNAAKNIFLIILFIFFDQLSKYMIRHFGGFYICNKGIAFGIGAQDAILWIFIASIVYFGFLILNEFSNLKLKNFNLIENLKLKIENYKSVKTALILVSAGAISNIADRLTRGCVIDFIDLKFWPVFNLADSFIVMGVIMLILHNIKRVTHNEK